MSTTLHHAERQARQWWLVDAQGRVLGRLASRLALILRGKHKPAYTPYIDTGDFVVVINAAKIAVTGQKLTQKTYARYSGYPSGLRVEVLGDVLKRDPERVIRQAVKGMLPRGPLARQMLTKLKIYPGPEHPHAAQQPSPVPERLIPPPAAASPQAKRSARVAQAHDSASARQPSAAAGGGMIGASHGHS